MSTLVLEPITPVSKASAGHLGYASDARCRALVLTTEPHRTLALQEQAKRERYAHVLLMRELATLRRLP
jgi:hypothetical protein